MIRQEIHFQSGRGQCFNAERSDSGLQSGNVPVRRGKEGRDMASSLEVFLSDRCFSHTCRGLNE